MDLLGAACSHEIRVKSSVENFELVHVLSEREQVCMIMYLFAWNYLISMG